MRFSGYALLREGSACLVEDEERGGQAEVDFFGGVLSRD